MSMRQLKGGSPSGTASMTFEPLNETSHARIDTVSTNYTTSIFDRSKERKTDEVKNTIRTDDCVFLQAEF